MVAFMRDKVREEVHHIQWKAGDLCTSIEPELEQADDAPATPFQRWNQLISSYSTSVDALRHCDAVLRTKRLDPHAATIVDVAGDHADGTTRSAGDLLWPQLSGEVLKEKDRDAVIGLPSGNNRISRVELCSHVHFPGSGTERLRHIFRARTFGISLCRGTASTAPVLGLHHSECDRPSRFR